MLAWWERIAGHTSVPVLRFLASMRGSSRFGYACAQGIFWLT